ncbi:MAG: ATP-dependent helicase HrpB [Gammaproteobacteria bacterium]
MIHLPVDEAIPPLLAALAVRNVAVLQAPPGAGKTTRVPLALHAARAGDAGWLGPQQKVLMLEPRRLAARAAARWMAQQLGESAGATVGYRTRLDTKVSAATRVEVVTEGVLTRMLQNDPSLAGYGIVIFDEFHERSLNADLGLALVRESQLALREDLRVLVMSATLDAAPVAALLRDAVLGDAPVITSAGRAFPVSTRYRAPSRTANWLDHLVDTLPDILAAEEGSALVFLPGAGEIRRVQSQLKRRLPADVRVLPLYGDLAGDAQDEAIAPARPGTRKVVLATSIAETSLTIDGVRIVVDAGWQRSAVFDPGSAMTRLVTRRVSAAAADQRRGRAGRTAPGICIRLWGEGEALSPFSAAEILEADLSGVVLELAQWGVRDPRALAWLDVPPAAAWEQGVALLRLLEAIDAQGAITPHGARMLEIGLPPRLAHLVVRGRELGHGRLAADIAALLSERDLPGRDAGVDLRTRVEALRGESRHHVDRNRLAQVRDSAKRLYPRDADRGVESTETVGLLLALAYPDRVARRRGASAEVASHRYLLANGRGALLPEGDGLAKHGWLVCADLDGDAREARVYLAAPVTQEGIERALAADIVDEDFTGWDAATEAVVARRRRKLGAIVIDEKLLATPSPEQVQAALLAAIRERGLAALPWDERSRQWRARVQLLHGIDAENWPDVSDAALLATLDHWLAPFMNGMTRLGHLKNLPLADALRSLLSYAAQQKLDTLAPERWTVPTGSQIAIDYCAENGPVLAVKLQEMFGATQTPAVAGGRVPLTLHLLSPAQRPVAVTRNLVTFWQQGYPDVRKDLRGRYPKHPWPEDPLTAPPQRGVKRRE